MYQVEFRLNSMLKTPPEVARSIGGGHNSACSAASDVVGLAAKCDFGGGIVLASFGAERIGIIFRIEVCEEEALCSGVLCQFAAKRG